MNHIVSWLRLFVFTLTSLIWQYGFAQLVVPENGFSIGFYNVENLFDTINDPLTRDEDFLPESKMGWNTVKYFHKLDNLARVIAAMDTTGFPHFLGLSEVENSFVLNDLVAQPQISDADYGIIHVEDTDPRGIEVAALYRRNYFQPVEVRVFRPIVLEREQRHILYVKGLIARGDTLHLFVNHWNSRYGGVEKTKNARKRLAIALRQRTDSILNLNPFANIVIMGDLNDNPTDESSTLYLKALPVESTVHPAQLYNLALEPYENGEGSYFYKQWDLFDQIIVSSSLIQGQPLGVSKQQIIRYDWMLYFPNQGPPRPNRSSGGGRYYGGFSDHLPVMVRLFLN